MATPEENAIKAGDIVQLKHGGPIMTVTQVDQVFMGPKGKSAWCTWNDAHGKILTGTFPLEALRKPSKASMRVHAVKGWISFITSSFARIKD